MSHKYTLEGPKNPISGNFDLQYSLRSIMAACHDFKNEETALQFLGSQLGVQVLLTPKCHAELLAGEGIEFSWGQAKQGVLPLYSHISKARKGVLSNL